MGLCLSDLFSSGFMSGWVYAVGLFPFPISYTRNQTNISDMNLKCAH